MLYLFLKGGIMKKEVKKGRSKMTKEKNFLYRLRRDNDKTQQEVADYLGIEQANYNRMEKADMNRISPLTISKLAKFYDITTDHIINASITVHPKSVRLPVLGFIPAGTPIEAVEEIVEYIDVKEDMLRSGEFFGLKIRGDSMSPRICNNDVVIIRKQEDCDTGDVCAVMINGDNATLKQVRKDNGGISLIPFNTEYKPMFYTNQQVNELPIKIIGKVIEGRYSV